MTFFPHGQLYFCGCSIECPRVAPISYAYYIYSTWAPESLHLKAGTLPTRMRNENYLAIITNPINMVTIERW